MCATTAPWALACSLLVSFTATAANDAQSGHSSIGLSPLARIVDSANLIPPVAGLDAFALPRIVHGSKVLQARLAIDLPDDSDAAADQVAPRSDMKAQSGTFPSVERGQKGDPVLHIRPTLSRRAGDVRQPAGSRLMFSRDERLLPPTILMLGAVQGPEREEQGFDPSIGMEEFTTTRQATSVQSPAAAAAGSTGAASGSATPSVSRATALSSTTPAPAEATPVEIAAAPVSPLQSPRLDRPGAEDAAVATRLDPERPRYAELIDPDKMGSEQRCLAEAVYFEARSEPEEGQAAVAQVVLNRVKSGLYPPSICGVVYQNRHRHLACQFTFACEGRALRITDRESWDSAKRVADAVLEGRTYVADVGGATHYHADYVKPSWSRRLKKMDVIGRHIFYKLRPGQT